LSGKSSDFSFSLVSISVSSSDDVKQVGNLLASLSLLIEQGSDVLIIVSQSGSGSIGGAGLGGSNLDGLSVGGLVGNVSLNNRNFGIRADLAGSHNISVDVESAKDLIDLRD